MKSIQAHMVAGLALLLSATLSAASPNLEAQLETAERAQRGIVTFTGAHFQSCAPLLNPNANPVEAMRSAWGTSASYTRTNRCTDRRDANFNYVSFMNGSIHPNAGQLKSRRGKLNAFARLNCSGFVAGTLAAAGLNYFVDQESRTYSPTTHELRSVFNRDDTCFYKPELSREVSLLPGDIINVSAGHVVTIVSVGADPLGFNAIDRRSDCDRISASNFDFTIAHSSSNDKGSMSGVRIEEAKNASTSIIRKLAKYAKKFCKNRFSDGLEGRIDDVKVGERTYGVWPFQVKRDQVWALRRHHGDDKEGCQRSRAATRGASCLQTACRERVASESNWAF